MPDRETLLRTIDAAYACRAAGDLAGANAFLAPGATFRIAGDGLPIPGIPPTEATAHQSVADLIGAFTFHEVERLDALVDGLKVAVHSRVRMTPASTGQEIVAELYDLWTFNPDGKMTSGLQFLDAALIAHVLAATPRS